MDKTIILEKDMAESRIIARAKREANEMVLTPGEKHTIFFKGPVYDDLVIIELKDNKWNFRKCTDEEWLKYFNEFIK